MTREDDPLKQTPACELDRDNRAMTRREPDIAARNETADLQIFNSALERALAAECDSQRTEIERQQADINKLMSERDGWLQEIEARITAIESLRGLNNQLLADCAKAEVEIERLRAFEWAWQNLSLDLREFMVTEAPEWAKVALDPKP